MDIHIVRPITIVYAYTNSFIVKNNFRQSKTKMKTYFGKKKFLETSFLRLTNVSELICVYYMGISPSDARFENSYNGRIVK